MLISLWINLESLHVNEEKLGLARDHYLFRGHLLGIAALAEELVILVEQFAVAEALQAVAQRRVLFQVQTQVEKRLFALVGSLTVYTRKYVLQGALE